MITVMRIAQLRTVRKVMYAFDHKPVRKSIDTLNRLYPSISVGPTERMSNTG